MNRLVMILLCTPSGWEILAMSVRNYYDTWRLSVSKAAVIPSIPVWEDRMRPGVVSITLPPAALT